MRTTLTLDDDVSAIIERLRRERAATLRDVVNEALRLGLAQMEKPQPRRRFRTETVSLGRCRLANLDDVASALALAEGEAFR